MLKPISLEKLGLVGMSNFTEKDISIAKKNLVKKLIFSAEIFSVREFSGYLRENDKSYKNQVAIEMNGKSISAFDEVWLLEKINSINDVVSLMKVIEILSAVFPPLYVGITISQTLRSRYDQHWNNYNAGRPKCFSARLHENSIDWSELNYMAIEIPTELINDEMIGFCEDLMHGLTKPIFSYY